MHTCQFCKWEGSDVQPFKATETDRQVLLCFACRQLPMDIFKLKDLPPHKLIPIIRATAMQATSAAIGQAFGELTTLISQLAGESLSLAQRTSILQEIIDRAQQGIPLKKPDDPADYGPN